jgi:peptide/nickel transport system substrate-binding protein
MRKLFMIILGILILISLIASSCSQNASSSPTVPKTTAAPAASSSIPVTVPSSSVSTQPQTGGTLKVILRGGSGGNLGVLGSVNDIGTVQRITAPVFDLLLNVNAKEELQPGLAESFEVSNDGKKVTLHLRKGIKFSDGTDFNAAAVQYNLQNLAPNNVKPPELNAITSYEILDDYTLRLNFEKFNVITLMTLMFPYGFMASPTAWQVKTTPDNMAKDHMVGTGPFLFSSWQRNNFVKYVKNPGYWQKGKPYLDGIEMNQVIDPVTSLISFQKGEGQVIFGLTPDEAKTLKAAGFDIITAETKTVWGIYPDGANSDSPFANKLVRQALEYAIDKKALAANVGSGYFTVANQTVPDDSPYYISGLSPRDYNPQKAKELLTQANYPSGFKTTLLTTSANNQDAVVAIQSYLKAVNIDTTIDVADAARFGTAQTKGWKGLLLPNNPVSPSQRIFCSRLTTTADYVSCFKPDWFKAKSDAIQAQPDYNQRLAGMKDIVKGFYDESVSIPLWFGSEISAQVKNVKGLDWGKGSAAYYYDPASAWLSK